MEPSKSTMMGQDAVAHPRGPHKPSAPAKSKKIYVKHDHRDHYLDPYYDPIQAEQERDEGTHCGPRGGVVEPFPSRLYEMLTQAEKESFDHVVSWQPHGRSFLLHDPKKFVADVLPRCFKQSKLASFQRQVNLYGFRRLTTGPDRGAYYNPLFLKGRPDLHRRIVRMRVKGTGVKPTSSPDTEPNFYAFRFCTEQPTPQVALVVRNEGNTDQGAPAAKLVPTSTLATAMVQPRDSLPETARMGRTMSFTNETLEPGLKVDITLKAIGLLNARKRRNACAKHREVAQAAKSQTRAAVTMPNPLSAPRNFHYFNNFWPVSDNSEVAGLCHHGKSTGSGDQVQDGSRQPQPQLAAEPPAKRLLPYRPTPLLSARSPQSPPSSSPPPTTTQVPPIDKNDGISVYDPFEDSTPDPMEYHHDPFQDQIKDLIHDPMPVAVGRLGKCDRDIDVVLDWFRSQAPQRSFC